MAVTESLFVKADARKTGAGLKLIRAAERLAKALGCPAILVTAPKGGKLEMLLPHLKYRDTNTVFTKSFANG